MKDFKYYILFFVCLITFTSYAQREENLSASNLKQLGMSAERINDPYQAIDFYERYLDKVKEDPTISYRLAENYRLARNYKKAAEHYEIAFAAKPNKFTKALFYQAQMLHSLGKYKEAIPLYEEFRKAYRGQKDSYEYSRLSKNAVEGCELALADSLQTKAIISHLDKSINKAHIESSPIIYKNKLLFTSLPMDQLNFYPIESDSMPTRSFYYAVEKGREWTNEGLWKEMDFPKGASVSSGAFSLDGNNFYFSVCNSVSGKTICEIWKSSQENNIWNTPERLSNNVNDSRYSSSQPAVGTDYKGREVLYFVSDRKDGKGGQDIWYSRYNERNQVYDAARNCGSKINSKGDEMSPFIHPQNRNFYFSSNGHPGFGGMDIFKSVGERGKWVEPKNIGKPINSPVDEIYFVLNEEGESGFFASNRSESVKLKNEHCCDDLYAFTYPDFIKIKLVAEIVDIESGESVDGALVRIFMLPSPSIDVVDEDEPKEILLKEIYSENGMVEIPVEAGYDYVLKVKQKDYLQSNYEFSTKNQRISTELNTKINLEKIPFTALVINNIYYEFDKDGLTKDAKITIDTTILPILQNNPEIKAEIGSHTDSKGTDAYNMHLSQKRAESVVKYLRQKGIDKTRLSAKGYGESQPIAKNKNEDGSDNEEGRAKNRRTEFKVIGILDVDEIEYNE